MKQLLKYLNWATKEFNGYTDDDLMPSYRQNVKGEVYTNSSGWHAFHLSRFDRSVPRLLAIIQDKDTTGVEGRFTKALVADAEKAGIGCTIRDTFSVHKNDILSVLSLIKRELLRRLNIMITEITYGNIPEGIFRGFQTKVNEKLTQSNPEAVSELNIAYESLGRSEDPERTAHVAFATRRLIKAVADNLLPPKNGEKLRLKDGREFDIGDERFLNRLEAYVDSKSSPNTKYLLQ